MPRLAFGQALATPYILLRLAASFLPHRFVSLSPVLGYCPTYYHIILFHRLSYVIYARLACSLPYTQAMPYIYTMSFTKISFIQAIKYPYLVNLSTIINILLYSYPVIGSFNFSNFTIKSHNMTFYGLLANLTSCNNLYSLYLLSLFLQQSRHFLVTYLAIFQIP